MKYEATENQMENLKLKDDFLLSGDGVFHTIQGEGDMVGVPTTLMVQYIDLYITKKEMKRTLNIS